MHPLPFPRELMAGRTGQVFKPYDLQHGLYLHILLGNTQYVIIDMVKWVLFLPMKG